MARITIFDQLKVRIPVSHLLATALLLVLAGCSALGTKVQPPCPPVLVLKDTAELVRFRPGPGRDITDVLFRANVVDFRAQCKYNRARTEVDIDLSVLFDVRRGPADRERKAAFDYFVAIPQFYPAPQGKQVFPTGVAFEGNQVRLRYRDRIELTVPLDPKRSRGDYAIYIGFQLTPDEVAASRRRGRPR